MQSAAEKNFLINYHGTDSRLLIHVEISVLSTRYNNNNILNNGTFVLGLLPMRGPKGDLLHPLQRRKWRKFNTYFDEKTIKAKYNNV